ncbi:BCCT family transporter [Micromonospora schwarzwaldensis]|uniref:BCCT family transporter n=1 Tax=Micromonospora sp. DSM 45708 TaxID=3111767 RepID=UPI0031D5E84A
MAEQVGERPATQPADLVVLGLGVAGVLAVVAWGVFARGSLASFGAAGLNWTIDTFGWFFVVAADAFLVLAVAALLLVGGLDALQQATILVALPFVVVMLGLAVALVREMAADPVLRAGARPRRSGLAAAVRAARSYEEEDPPPVTRWLHRPRE